MNTHTGLRISARGTAFVAAVVGVAMAVPAAPASAGTHPTAAVTVAADGTSDLSPSTRKAWSDFIEGGAEVAGGAARMVSGAWIGAPAIVVAATGGELSPTQVKAWRNWDEGAEQGGQGVAKVVSGAYVGAPGYIIDKIESGATPGDLSASELKQVSFLTPAESLPTDGLPTDLLPLSTILGLLGSAPV